MIDFINMKNFFTTLLIGSFLFCPPLARAEVLDKIIAVVEDDVILDRELEQEVSVILQRIQNDNTALPPRFVLRKQVLEKMIVDKLQRQLAEKAGVTVSEETLNRSVGEIARRNNMDVQGFRIELERQGMSYESFQENVRNEIIINELRGREIGGRIKVTDQEIQHYLETQDQGGTEAEQYHLGHILIAVKEGASSSEIQQASSKAESLVTRLRAGEDFTQTAISNSDDGNA